MVAQVSFSSFTAPMKDCSSSRVFECGLLWCRGLDLPQRQCRLQQNSSQDSRKLTFSDGLPLVELISTAAASKNLKDQRASLCCARIHLRSLLPLVSL